MKTTVTLIFCVLAQGCAQIAQLPSPTPHGLRPGDVCVRCGDKIMQLPNGVFDAQRRWHQGERW